MMAGLELGFGALTASGALLGLSYLPGVFGVFAWVAYIPLLCAVRRVSPGRAFFFGWFCGTLCWIIAAYWLVHTIRSFAEFGAPGGLILFFAVCAFHGIAFALPAALSRALEIGLTRNRGWRPDAAFFAAAVPSIVGAACYFPNLVPARLAETQMFHLPMVQLLELTGPAGVAWLVAGVNAGAAVLLLPAWTRLVGGPGGCASGAPRPRRRFLAAAVALVLINEVYGAVRIRQVDSLAARRVREGRSIRVALIQGAVPDQDRFLPERFERNLGVYRRLTARALSRGGVDLAIWPQSTYERIVRFGSDDADYAEPTVGVISLAAQAKVDLPFSAHLLVSPPQARKSIRSGSGRVTVRRYKGAVLLSPSQQYLGFSAKRFPTPLGEFIPLGRFVPSLYKLTPQMERISAGPQDVLHMMDGTELGVFMCYDAVKPESARTLAGRGAELLINPSSDAGYFDDIVEPRQHLRVAAQRAVETRRYLMRSVGSGISAVVAPTGRIVRSLPVGERGFIVETAALMKGKTLYTLSGDVFALAALAGLILLAVLAVPLPRANGASASDSGRI